MLSTLHDMRLGASGRVTIVDNVEFARNLEVMGIRTGVIIAKVLKTAGNGTVVRVGDARVCVSAEISKKVTVDLSSWSAE